MAAILDHYSRNARLTPAFICAIPISITLAAFGSVASGAVATVTGTGSVLGLTALLAQLGRDRGKRKEKMLFELWGGKPSVAKLRHKDNSINSHTKARYFEVAEHFLPKINWPTATEELKDPSAADQKYEALSNFLLERTRDSKKYPLVYTELVNYGFRRNLWGLKTIGLTCAVLSFAAIFIQILYRFYFHVAVQPVSVAAVVADALFIVIWWVWITPDWVRIPADAYAEKLLAACENL